MYNFCDGNGNMERFCTVNPYEPNSGMSELDKAFYPFKDMIGNPIPMKPFKISKKICLVADGYIPDFVSVQACNDQVCLIDRPSFAKADFQSDLNRALSQWNCICGENNDPCQCTVKVRLESNPELFLRPKTQVVSTTLDFVYGAGGSASKYSQTNNIVNQNCELDCDKLSIYLNATSDRIGVGTSSQNISGGIYYSGHYFLTSSYSDANWTDPTLIPYANHVVYTALAGLAVLFNADFEEQNGTLDNKCSCNDTDGPKHRMNDQTGQTISTKTLSDCSKCMYKRLYCPVVNSVNERTPKSDFIVTPNPSNGIVKVTTSSYFSDYYIDVYSTVGSKVLSLASNLHQSQDLTFQLSASGSYVIVFKDEKGSVVCTKMIQVYK